MTSPLVPLPPNYPPTVPTPPPAPVKQARPASTTARRARTARRRQHTPARVHIDQHPRLRAVAYNGAAAGAGWALGLGPWMLDGITHYGTHDTARGVWVGAGLTLVSLVVEWRTHTSRSPGRPVLVAAFGWAGRIPLATALLALALYGPDATL